MMSLKVTDICMYISAATVHIFLDVIDILRQSFENQATDKHDLNATNTTPYNDLWSVKSTSTENWLNADEGTFVS